MPEETEVIIVLSLDGVAGAYVQNGTFATGKAAVEALFAALGTQMPLINQTDVESHRANPDQVEELHHQQTHQHGGHTHGQ
jgi:hypothetical protein